MPAKPSLKAHQTATAKTTNANGFNKHRKGKSMNAQTPIGHNNPPDPIDEITSQYADSISEAENWLDGEAVTSEDQMKSVDALLKDVRAWGTALGSGQKDATAPLHDAWKAEIARWKPTVDDAARLKKGLAALVSDFKKKLAAEKEAARRKAWEEADAKRIEAEKHAALADPKNIEEVRTAEFKAIEAKKAEIDARQASKDTVKGLKSYTVVEVTDYRACINWIAQNDKEAIRAFCDEYARKNDGLNIGGVAVTKEKRAY